MMPKPRWRRNKRRAVSPIIATILLVAITVVLAAVLYILISGLGSTGSKPYDLGLGQGTPSQTTVSGKTSYYDTFSLSATSGLTTSLFGLKITNASGSAVGTVAAVPTACGVTDAASVCLAAGTGWAWYAILETSTGNVAATFTGSAWSSGTSPVTVTSAYSIVIVSASQLAGTGSTLSSFGTTSSAVSGSTTM